MRGFKSFPDEVEVRLEPGVAVVVGPNGSGKSNIADALVWASGSLAPSELRAEKPDDVLFGGVGGTCGGRVLRGRAAVRQRRPGAAGARLLRGVDRAPAAPRRRGPVPRERRSGAPDRHRRAARRRRSRPRGRVDRQPGEGRGDPDVERGRPTRAGRGRRGARAVQAAPPSCRAEARARGAAGRARARPRDGGREAAAAARAPGDGGRARREARQGDRRAARRDRDDRSRRARRRGPPTRSGVAAPSSRSAVGSTSVCRRSCASASGPRRSWLRWPEAARVRRRCCTGCAAAASGSSSAVRRPESCSARLREPVVEHLGEQLLEQARVAEARAAALRRALDEREGLPPAARALSERGERLALGELDVEPGSRACSRGSARVIAPRPCSRRRPSAGSSSSSTHARPVSGTSSSSSAATRRSSSRELPVVPLERPAPLARPGRDRARASATTRLAASCGSSARRRRRSSSSSKRSFGCCRRRPATSGRGQPRPSRECRHAHPRADRARGAARGGARTLHRGRPAPRGAARRRDASGVVAGAAELAAELRRLGAAEAEIRHEASGAGERASAVEVELARLEAEVGRGAAPTRRGERGAGRGPARRAGWRSSSGSSAAASTLGGVNPFAKEEYEREKEHLEELRTQRADLERSLAELDKLRRELTETVERRFAETFAAVERNFAEVAGTLFPGGEGRLRLTRGRGRRRGRRVRARDRGRAAPGRQADHAPVAALGRREGDRGDLVPVRALPRAAVRLLPAGRGRGGARRHEHRPLRRAAARSSPTRAQFIVVTHQKRTMEAADILYGVTMGGDGVSQVVSRRLPREEAEAAA